MWLKNRWWEEPELSAYIKELERERDTYKQELTETLRKVIDHFETSPCARDCNNCPHFWQNECPDDEFALRLTERWWELHDKS